MPQNRNENLLLESSRECSPASTIPSEHSFSRSSSLQSHTQSSPPRLFRNLLKTGYVYDVFMSYHANLNAYEFHPEDPRRIFYIYREMKNQGLLDISVRIPVKKATKELILTTHTKGLYKLIRSTKTMDRKELIEMEENNDSIYVNSHSFESSLYAAGGLVELCKAVLNDEVKNGFAIIRPPGHHAEYDTAMGFCFFNNVAIATKYCIDQLNAKRIMIVDWDIHFGNGTQKIFEDKKNVLYVSLHRYEEATFYPGDKSGAIDSVGKGHGRGRTVNIPWTKYGMKDSDYIYAFHQVILPIGYEFSPDLVIVSAGFDSAKDDHIGQCNVTPTGYSIMTHLLMGLARGRVVMALEGGYNLKATSISATACMNVLVGEAPLATIKEPPSLEGMMVVKDVKRVQRQFWKCLK
ncbi:hypothetical protein BJ944DRAFT_159616 [Cunninghamella echinulata]|nr:hypothetical protein BJ944DRAFT_159616 [Cunninghamella echinulata]